jgi:hypothetical protein
MTVQISGHAEPRRSRSMEYGLAILQCFTTEQPVLRNSDIASAVGISRATSHRHASPAHEAGSTMRSGSVMSSSGNQARRCLFCEADSPLSREHVWPRWIATLLPEGHRFSSRGTVGRYDGQPRAKFGEVFESVDSCSWTARVVCDSCNSGWMSTLESAAQPILGPLLTGESEAIRGIDLTVAFRWAVKTAIMIGAGTGNPWQLEPRQARALRDGKAPRIISRVSLARVPEGLDGWAHVERLKTKVADRPGALFC